MRYLKLFESFEDIKEICRRYNIIDYTINTDGSIDVDGNAWLYNRTITKLQLKFNKSNGCECNNIKSFEYFPSFVKDTFFCLSNPIYYVWNLFRDTTKIELLNDFDIFRDEDTDIPSIFIDRLNDFLLTIGKDPV